MSPKQISDSLGRIAAAPDFSDQANRLADEWSVARNAEDAVEPILRFIESNPDVDYGMPGPLVHFVERFRGDKYEGELIRSVNRRIGLTLRPRPVERSQRCSRNKRYRRRL